MATGGMTGPNPSGPVLAIVGPTAAGKSALALALAEKLGGEVVNADSMQLYRGMDIGTAKLPPDERRGVPHHLLDIWEVTRPASVADYQRLARLAIDDILSRGRVPLLVGGSGLYLRAVLEHFDFPGTDPDLRAALDAELTRVGPGILYERLAAADPAAAASILPGNGRRIVRALEVIELTGRPFTARLPVPTLVYPTVSIGVDIDTEVLDRRIADRVARMWTLGLIDEVRALLPLGLADALTASRALGYQQVLAHLAGSGTSDRAAADTIIGTRQFVRRQRKWFRRDPRIVWLDGDSSRLVDDALATVHAARGE